MAHDGIGYDDILSGGAPERSFDAPREPRVPRRPLGRILGVGSLVVALLAGAAVYLSASGGDVDNTGPESVLPGSAFAFAMVDLEPAAEQGKAVREFALRFPSGRADSMDRMRGRVVSALTGPVHLDYTRDVQPWLGRRAAIAGFPAAEGRPSFVIALEKKNAGAAAALTAIDDPPAYIERGNYVLIAPDHQSLSAALAATDDVALSAEPQFVADMARLDGPQVAVSWTDNAASADAVLYDMEHPRDGQEFGGVETYFARLRDGAVGRTVMGIRAYATYAELLGYTVGRGAAEAGTIADLKALPDTTIGAAFAANANSLLTGSDGGLFTSFGIAGKLPPFGIGIASLLYGFAYQSDDLEPAVPPPGNALDGAFTNATIALGSLPVGSARAAPDLALIAAVADPTRADKAVSEGKSQFADAFSSTPFTQIEDGVLTFASSRTYAAQLRTGALGETGLFKTAMGPLGERVELAVFANLERVRDAVPGYPEQLLPIGAIGMSSTRDGDVSALRVRFVWS